MKKSVVCFIILIFIILFGILFFKIYLSNPKYSSEELYALVQKGIESMHDMQNVCIIRKNWSGVAKFYYKGNKMKSIRLERTGDTDTPNSYCIVDLDEKKQYLISDEEKFIGVEETTYLYDKGLQYDVYDRIKPKDNVNFKRELSYIKEETIEGKDCILAKEILLDKMEDGSFQDNTALYYENVYVYWIEKSTGFVLGLDKIKLTQKDATPEVWIQSITFNEVVDSDFDLPTGYKIYKSRPSIISYD